MLFTPFTLTAKDADNKPAAGGRIYTKTSTGLLKPTYTDSSGKYFCTNPIILDFTGTAVVWGEQGDTVYIEVTNSTGTPIENVPAFVVFPAWIPITPWVHAPPDYISLPIVSPPETPIA